MNTFDDFGSKTIYGYNFSDPALAFHDNIRFAWKMLGSHVDLHAAVHRGHPERKDKEREGGRKLAELEKHAWHILRDMADRVLLLSDSSEKVTHEFVINTAQACLEFVERHHEFLDWLALEIPEAAGYEDSDSCFLESMAAEVQETVGHLGRVRTELTEAISLRQAGKIPKWMV